MDLRRSYVGSSDICRFDDGSPDFERERGGVRTFLLCAVDRVSTVRREGGKIILKFCDEILFIAEFMVALR